jgi:flagellar protein FliL
MAKAPAAKPETEAEPTEADGEASPKKRRLSGKKLVLFVALPVLLLGGGGAGAYFMGFLDSLLGVESTATAAAEVEQSPSFYYEMPEMLVNLTSTNKKPAYLKLRLDLELPDKASGDKVDAMLPRIVDSFQVYLRALRVEDLQGSAGLYRVRQELLSRVSMSVANVEIRDVLFKEMLVQ